MTTEEERKAEKQAYQKKWRAANPERVSEIGKKSTKKWRAAHPEYSWKKKYPEKARESHRLAQLKWRAKPGNRTKIYARKKVWDSENRARLAEYGRNQYYVTKYGITAEQRDAEIAARKSQCDCCGQKKRLCVDHFHGTKTIRGFLCDGCNTLIGKFKDCPIAIRQLADYAEKRQCPSTTQLRLL